MRNNLNLSYDAGTTDLNGHIDTVDEYLKNLNISDFQSIKDNLNFSENLCWALHFDAVTPGFAFTDRVIAMVNLLSERISNNQPDTPTGLAAVCAQLYKLTGDESLLDKAIAFISAEELPSDEIYTTEQIITRNIFSLLHLYKLSSREDFLLRINLSILKLLNLSCYDKKGIYWPFLYRLNPASRKHEENLLKLVFLTLHRVFKNPTFKYITDNITTKAGNSKSVTLSDYTKRNTSASAPDQLTVQALALLSKATSLTGDIPAQATGDVINKIQKNNKADKHLINGIVYFNAFKLVHNEEYLQLAKANLFKAISNYPENNQEQTTDTFPILNNLLSLIFSNVDSFDPFFANTIALNENFTADTYPVISITETEVRQLILFNNFPKVIELLRNEIPQKFKRFINAATVSNSGDEIKCLIKFVRAIIVDPDIKPELKTYLIPVFKLELTGLKLMQKYQGENYRFTNDAKFINEVLKLDEEQFTSLRVNDQIDIKIIHIKWNPALKTHAFIFKHYFVFTDEDLIALRYDPLEHKVAEFVVDQWMVTIFKILKKEPVIGKALKKIIPALDPKNERPDEVKAIVIKRIRNLIENDLLFVENEILIDCVA